MVLVWDVTTWTGDEKEPLLHFVGHTQPITCLAATPNGFILSGSSDLCSLPPFLFSF